MPRAEPRDRARGRVELLDQSLLRPHWNVVDRTAGLEHASIVHDPFHILKLAGAAIGEVRREVFFGAGTKLRAVGAGRRLLLLRAWERNRAENERPSASTWYASCASWWPIHPHQRRRQALPRALGLTRPMAPRQAA